jgi:hypothetical protein
MSSLICSSLLLTSPLAAVLETIFSFSLIAVRLSWISLKDVTNSCNAASFSDNCPFNSPLIPARLSAKGFFSFSAPPLQDVVNKVDADKTAATISI